MHFFLEWILENSFYINIILAIIIVFFQRKDPSSVWAWLLLLYFIPILGFILYLIIGYDYRKEKRFRSKEIEDQLHAAIEIQESRIRNRKIKISEGYEAYDDLVLYNLKTNDAIYTNHNHITIFTDGTALFEDIVNEILGAKKYIHIQSYIIRDGQLLKHLLPILKQKVKEGVSVRLFFDGIGGRAIRKQTLRALSDAGISVGVFFPALFGKLHLRMNYRNHRKIIVIDGICGYIGGFNIGDEYLGLNPKFGYWRDTHLKLSGEAVFDLQLRFAMDWHYATGENLFRQQQYFEIFKHPDGKSGVQIISSGPDSKYEEIKTNILQLIHKAKQYIYIQTPYFIPDKTVLHALTTAALSGVDVRIMIPAKPDHPFVFWVTQSYLGEILEAGGKIFCYETGFLHAKGTLVDGVVCSYGTANMDYRSFELNFEINATIYDQNIVREFEKIFIADLMNCHELTWETYQNRKISMRIKEQICRLLAPLM